MNWRRWLPLAGCISGLAGCEYEEVERVIGYQGEARRNPWLAAERMVSHYGYDVESLTSWRPPLRSDAVWIVPASVLGNEGTVRRAEKWVRTGGHLVVLLEMAGVEANDWRGFGPELEIESALVSMIERAGIRLDQTATSANAGQRERIVPFDGDEFKVIAGAGKTVAVKNGEAGVFASAGLGRGLLTAVADARMFRNRWIDVEEHAELLLALVEATERDGSVVFVRGATLSFWGLLKRHLWAVLIGLAALLALWLWRSMRRIGPLEAATLPPVARGYDHHLEALGNFHWQLDRAANLLDPLRRQLAEHGQRGCERAGLAAAGLHEWLAERSGLPVARVEHALAGAIPADGAALTRMVADLQVLLKLPHHGAQPADQPTSQPPPLHPPTPTPPS